MGVDLLEMFHLLMTGASGASGVAYVGPNKVTRWSACILNQHQQLWFEIGVERLNFRIGFNKGLRVVDNCQHTAMRITLVSF